MAGHVGPEAMDGGPIALVHEGDSITFDAEAGTLSLNVAEAELAARRGAWRPIAPRYTTGALAKYARSVGPACFGAVTS
jgi:dihydroxy-acid dehydratase